MPAKIQISMAGKAHAKNRSAAYAVICKQDVLHATPHGDETLDFWRYL
jgi:hypothetical protein